MDSYPMGNTVDGIDTSKATEGAMKNALNILGQHKEWQDSKTGEKVPPPDWAAQE